MTIGGSGTLTLRQEGPRIHMDAQRPADGKGLYKVWLHGDHGGKFLLGTLVPENGLLRLHRTLAIDTLDRAGCWPRFRAEASLAFAFTGQNGSRWYCEHHPDHLVADPLLKEQLKDAMLCRREQDCFSLAAPFRTDRPMCLPALFCLSQVERWNGQLHLVWHFDSHGQPKLPHKKE